MKAIYNQGKTLMHFKFAQFHLENKDKEKTEICSIFRQSSIYSLSKIKEGTLAVPGRG